ncbi:hypothetical protein COLO4_06115 [Corchorus olitorius]|uniref:F-box domain-containing protein n=1 Tax=Corchorus olitorius TaxID=93759 RepID=A0A1R3KNX3_9ROSI|nr:hypothetical protein COLO4_06115 [Corchorus olitorius]
MASIPLDIINDILCRLSVEDLLRFRCISKPWCSLIDSPNFIKLHLSHSLKTHTRLSLILKDNDSDYYSVNLDSLQTAQKINHAPDGNQTPILGSCNGLLALLNPDDQVILWNPSTRKSKLLPVSEVEFPPDYIVDFVVYGLGYDPFSDDYKLVRMVQFVGQGDDSISNHRREVKVYNLKTDSWRRVKDFPLCLRYAAHGILVSNALHWVASEKSGLLGKSFVAAFDLGTEDYHVVQLPNLLSERFHLIVEAMEGCLCIIVKYWEIFVDDIWIMKEYGSKNLGPS